MRRCFEQWNPKGWWRGLCWVLLLLLVECWVGAAPAQGTRELRVGPAPDVSALVGRPIASVRVEVEGNLWDEEIELTTVRPGDLFLPELVRRGMRELEATGRFAEVSGTVESIGSHVELIYVVRSRRLVASVKVFGSPIDQTELLRATGLAPELEITSETLEQAEVRALEECAAAGYPDARIELTTTETDDPLRVVVRLRVQAGEAAKVERVKFLVAPSPHHPALSELLKGFGVRRSMPLSRARIQEATEQLQKRLVAEAFYLATVGYRIEGRNVVVEVRSGPRFSLRIEGAQHFGEAELVQALQLSESPETRPEVLEQRTVDFLVRHGFLDARVQFRRIDAPLGVRAELIGWVREGLRFSVERRAYPCRTGIFSAEDLEAEVQGVLAEQFPGVAIVHPPAAPEIDAAVGTPSPSPRATPLEPAPYSSYSQDAYQAVRRHLGALYRSEGYLRSEVGPLHLSRRRCSALSPPGTCVPLGERPEPAFDCNHQPEETERVFLSCHEGPDVSCEPEGTLFIPVHAGPRATLYDVSLSGNKRFSEQELLRIAGFPLTKPARPAEIDAGLQRIRDFYDDQAYAFALVDSELSLSPDGTRAQLVISIEERDQVKVRRIDVRGASRTREGLIRKRIALTEKDFYYRPLVQKSERQLESLGVFSSVAISLEDPGIPAKEKVVVVTVTERLPQYVDIKGGFATADGFRIGFEYGHRNLGGNAIALLIRSQLGLRPVFLIPEGDVRAKYELLDLAELLERRNAITLGLPEVGLGPSYRLEIELLDVRDNNRDYGLTRDAGLGRLLYRPLRQWLFSLGASVEFNQADVFAVPLVDENGQIIVDDQGNPVTEKDALEDYLQNNPVPGNPVRVPEGPSLAFAQELRATWDRRDLKLAATRGTLVGLGVEHVTALPLAHNDAQGNPVDIECRLDASVFAPTCSEFLRLSGRIAGYIPLSKKGMTLALSLRSGLIVHLTELSNTYPDRLFFVGGVDTIRGYQQDSLVPQDYADDILANDDLDIASVVLRGGDFFINPRAEVRIPLGKSLQTAIFLDAGNLWADPTRVDLLTLRYAIGTGLRVQTPIGPLVFDYGFNIERLIQALDGREDDPRRDRYWEDIGAFHFSIGLF